MWVADMDFAAPPEVLSALRQRIDHGVLGYPRVTTDVVDAVLLHLSRDLGWVVDPDWLVWLPGLVTGLNVACRAVGESGDSVLTAVPIYPPFMSAPRLSERRLQTFELRQNSGHLSWDWDMDAMLAASDTSTRLLMLCNPHNPVGRVWRPDELQAIAEQAEKQDWVICSDDIHCELVLAKGVRYTPLATLSPEIARRTITLFAPSKTYNIPGLGASFAVIPDAGLRRRFERVMAGIVPHINVLGYTAMTAAYTYECPLAECGAGLFEREPRPAAFRRSMGYRVYVFMSPKRLTWPGSMPVRFNGLKGMSAARLFEQAGVGLSPGEDFLPGGTDFVRLNFGCTRATLENAIDRMAAICR